MTRREAERFLASYRRHAPEIEALAMALSEVRAGAVLPGKPFDGMPHSGKSQDLSGYAAQVDKLSRDLERKKKEAETARRQVMKAILQLRDPEDRAVLIQHYINGLTWTETAEKIGVTERHIYNLKNRAVQRLAKRL